MAKYPRPFTTTARPPMERKSKKREFYENFARKIRRAGLIRHHQLWTLSQGIKLYKDSFKGEDFVMWLMRSQNWSRDEALDTGQCLMDYQLIDEQTPGWARGQQLQQQDINQCQLPPPRKSSAQHQQQPLLSISTVPGAMNSAVAMPETPSPGGANPMTPSFGGSAVRSRSFSTDRYYKLTDDEDQKVPLNELDDNEENGEWEEGIDGTTQNVVEQKNNGKSGVAQTATRRRALRPPISVRDYNARLCTLLERIYALVLSEEGRRVHLDLLDDCELFNDDYRALSLQANFVDVASASAPDRLAFFINMHNAMLVHITHKFGLPGTIWQRRKYLYSIYYNIGGQLYSLQSIFNGILRGNRKGLGMLWRPFGDEDLRKEFIIDGGEPLAHFGLNNYTRSTPPIRVYSTENVYDELRANARECLASKEFLQVDAKAGQIRLAKLFKQYADDFGTYTEDTLCWIVRVMGASEERAALAKMLSPTSTTAAATTANYTVSFLPMDVDLNMTYGLMSSGGGGDGEENGAAGGDVKLFKPQDSSDGGSTTSNGNGGEKEFNTNAKGSGFSASAGGAKSSVEIIELDDDGEQDDDWEEGE